MPSSRVLPRRHGNPPARGEAEDVPRRQIAAVGRRGQRPDVRGPRGEERPRVVEGEQALVGDDGDAAAPAILGKRGARVAIEGLFDERDVELLERREGGERLRVGPPHVGVDADRNLRSDRFAHRTHPFDVLSRLESGLDLDVVEALFQHLPGHVAGPLGWTADDELDGDPLAHPPAPQLRQGQAGRLARQCPTAPSRPPPWRRDWRQ